MYSIQKEEPIVKITSGYVKGLIRNNNAVFYNIPFGDHCDKENRFMAPKEVPSWEKTLDCSILKGYKACQTQKEIASKKMKENKKLNEISLIFTGGLDISDLDVTNDENCLNLSLVTPCIDNKKRPVIVYIHGGGYTGGCSYIIPSICDKLCDEEDVVVVSIEHRLGALGFLYLGFLDKKYETSGINGLLDIILGLKWVKNNIEAFGGDPNNVTLYGESGGAMKISNLLAMPEAKGLFHKVYLNSGAYKAGNVSKETGEKQALEFLNNLGLTKDNYQDIYNKSVDEIIAAQEKVGGLVTWIPIADGKQLPYNKENTYKAYECSKDVKVMAGSSEDELELLAPKIILSKNKLLKQLKEDCKAGSLFKADITDDEIKSIIKVFKNKDNHKRNYTHTYFFIYSTFMYLGHGAYELSKELVKNNQEVYLYKITYDSPMLISLFKSAWHTADLPLSFRAVYLAEHERISKDMAHFMCEFVKGNKVVSSNITWEPFELDNKYTMVYDYKENHLVSDPDKDIHELFKKYKGNIL